MDKNFNNDKDSYFERCEYLDKLEKKVYKELRKLEQKKITPHQVFGKKFKNLK